MPLHLVIVEDNEADARLVEAYARETSLADAVFTRVGTVADAYRVLQEITPDAVLLDLGLPDAVGDTALTRLRRFDRDLPIIVLTGLEDERAGARALAKGAQDFLCKEDMVPRELARTVAQAMERRRLERRAERLREALRAVYGRYQRLVHGSLLGVFVVSRGRFEYVNQRMCTMTGYSRKELLAFASAGALVTTDDRTRLATLFEGQQQGRSSGDTQAFRILRKDGGVLHVETFVGRVMHRGQPGLIGGMLDMTERVTLQSQLQAARRMEAIGQLAAGIAHEINTPTQFIGDNLTFLRQAWRDLEPVIERLPRAVEDLGNRTPPPPLAAELADALSAADLGFIRDEVPEALSQSLDGVKRVADIVRAMKEFAHPGEEAKSAADLNRAVETTITVARNEWKYVAEVTTALDPDLPPVPCLLGEINQVLLNLLVNAAHAVADVVGDRPAQKGTITISTRVLEDAVEVRVQDSGAGIPSDLQERIFEPFFTTKEVGKGTGQGLALAHNVIVRRHGGQLWCESAPQGGATFVMRLPLTAHGNEHEAAA